MNNSPYYPLPLWEKGKALTWWCGVIAIVLIAWVTGDRVGAALLGNLSDRSNFRFSRLYSGGESNDYIVLGNSRGVNTFYVPRLDEITGLRGFNLAYNGMSMQIAEIIFTDYLDHNAPPKTVVIEVSCLIRGSQQLLGNLRPYLDRSPRMSELHRRYYPTAHAAASISHLYKYNNEMFLRVLHYLTKSDQSWINRYKIDSEFAQCYNPYDHGYSDFEVPEKRELDGLIGLIERAKQGGIDVRLIIGYLPTHVRGLQGLQTFVESIESATGMQVLDCSSWIKDMEAFSDPLHLNIDGAEKLSELLRGAL